MEIITDSIKTVVYHYKNGNLNYPMIIYISLAHIAAFAGICVLPLCHWYTYLWAFLLWPISGLGITAGAHRLWAHKAYNAAFPLRVFLMLVNSIANQGSIYHWSRDHRVHHKGSETNSDPHNATRGFFFAHMGWLFVKKHPDVIEAGKQLSYDDLMEDVCVRFQRKYDPWFALFMCYVFPAIVANVGWGEDFWRGFLVAGALRYVYVLHCTWLVNSAAHFYGSHPYDPDSHPAENSFVAVASIGEGWHNWHHKYPYDYACSEYGITKQFNPTKLFIDTMGFFGLAYDFKRATGAWNKLKKQREMEAASRVNDTKKEK